MKFSERSTMGGTEGHTVIIPCVQCQAQTEHTVVKSTCVSVRGPEYDQWDEYQILQCKGCRLVSFRHESKNTEDMVLDDAGDVQLASSEEVYPPRIVGRREMRGLESVPATVRRVYSETFRAVAASQPILAAAGMKACLEAVCKSKRVSGYRLSTKIDRLAATGLLTQRDAGVLHRTRFLGNRALHSIKESGTHELLAALDIIEHLLSGIYVLERRAQSMPRRRPRRRGTTVSTKPSKGK
jgi:hypothetical protein